MKIIWFRGALGNQIFDYALYLYLMKYTNKKKFYGYYKQRFPILVDEIFDIKLPPSNPFINLLSFFAFRFFRVIRLFSKNIPYCSTDYRFKLNTIFFDGYWQNKKYYKELKNWIEFKAIELDDLNKKILTKIIKTESVAIHIRRGDYLKLLDKNGLITKEYYMDAISLIKNRYSNPSFFFFSDDIEWVKENFKEKDSVYVTWNTGNKSYLDMYLMTFCKANIIANSTFSYWGAFLNKNNPVVIYPKIWSLDGTVNSEDLALEHWIGL